MQSHGISNDQFFMRNQSQYWRGSITLEQYYRNKKTGKNITIRREYDKIYKQAKLHIILSSKSSYSFFIKCGHLNSLVSRYTFHQLK